MDVAGKIVWWAEPLMGVFDGSCARAANPLDYSRRLYTPPAPALAPAPAPAPLLAQAMPVLLVSAATLTSSRSHPRSHSPPCMYHVPKGCLPDEIKQPRPNPLLETRRFRSHPHLSPDQQQSHDVYSPASPYGSRASSSLSVPKKESTKPLSKIARLTGHLNPAIDTCHRRPPSITPSMATDISACMVFSPPSPGAMPMQEPSAEELERRARNALLEAMELDNKNDQPEVSPRVAI
jgi:hypothetical protein